MALASSGEVRKGAPPKFAYITLWCDIVWILCNDTTQRIGLYFLKIMQRLLRKWSYMEKLYQGSFNPSIKHLETNMSRPGIESQPPASHADILPKSYPDGILIGLFWTATWLPQCLWQRHVIMTYTYMVAQICILACCQSAVYECQTDFFAFTSGSPLLRNLTI